MTARHASHFIPPGRRRGHVGIDQRFPNLLGVWHTDLSWLVGVGKNMMVTFHATQRPTVFFKLLDDLPAVHGGYDNHSIEIINTIT